MAASLSEYLSSRGFSETRIGVLVTATLLGSAVAIVAMARFAHRVSAGQVLRWSSVAMAVTGALFAVVPWYVVLLGVAAAGPLNPSSGDVSAFVPAEQSLLPSMVEERDRTALFARYSLVAFAAGAVGSALAGIPLAVGHQLEWSTTRSLGLVFWAYAAIGFVCLLLYRPMSRAAPVAEQSSGRLGPSRRKVRRLTALFALDSAGGGLVVNSLVAVWLDRRHGFSLAQVGWTLSLVGLLSACSSLAAPAIARRIGLVHTMVFTHLPANVFLMSVAFAPNGALAVVLLAMRGLLSQMDVPARQSYVMSIVLPEERAAAAAYTNVPRSLAAAATPALAGWLLSRSTFGWPLLLGGALKAIYDVALLLQFGDVEDPG